MKNGYKQRKQSLEKKAAIERILKLLPLGMQPKDMYAKLGKNRQYVKSTFDKHLSEARAIYSKRQEKLQKKLDEVEIEEAVRERKEGLKSRFELLMILQEQTVKILEDLDAGTTSDSYISNGKAKTYKRPLRKTEAINLQEQVRKNIELMQKVQGHFAAEKKEIEGSISFIDLLESS